MTVAKVSGAPGAFLEEWNEKQKEMEVFQVVGQTYFPQVLRNNFTNHFTIARGATLY